MGIKQKKHLTSFLFSPSFIFWVQASLLLIIMYHCKMLEPIIESDTKGYFLGLYNWKTMITSFRTPGYPLVLFLLKATPDLKNISHIPFFMVLTYFCSIFIFFRSLIYFGFAKWAAFWFATSVLYSNILFLHSSSLLPEIFAASMLILAISTLLFIIISPYNFLAWSVLVVTTLLSYLSKPSLIPLIIAIPLLSVFFLFYDFHIINGK